MYRVTPWSIYRGMPQRSAAAPAGWLTHGAGGSGVRTAARPLHCSRRAGHQPPAAEPARRAGPVTPMDPGCRSSRSANRATRHRQWSRRPRTPQRPLGSGDRREFAELIGRQTASARLAGMQPPAAGKASARLSLSRDKSPLLSAFGRSWRDAGRRSSRLC